jgi:hypothetical protein
MAASMAQFENANPAYNNPTAIQGSGDTGRTAPNKLGIYSSRAAGMQAGVTKLGEWAQRFPFLTVTEALARWQRGSSDLAKLQRTLTPQDWQSIVNESRQVGKALGVDPDKTTLGNLLGGVQKNMSMLTRPLEPERRPEGAGAAPAPVAGASVKQDVSFNITGATDPKAVASAVRSEMARVNQEMYRNLSARTA